MISRLLGLAWFSGVTGLIPMAGTPVMSWLVAVITALVLFIWLREAVRPSGGNRSAVLRFTPVALVLWAAAAILTPFALVALNGVRPLPELPISPFPWFLLTLLLGGTAAAYSMYLAIRRAPGAQPPTKVTEYREHWQESVHPMDIFRAIEITLAKHRFQEIPNRVYVNDVPQLVAQGSQNKGEFEGRTVQEVQPRPVADRRGDTMLRIGIAAGQALFLVAGITLFAILMRLTAITPAGLVQALLGAVILWTAGRLVAQTSTLYVSEIEFESDLIVFQRHGHVLRVAARDRNEHLRLDALREHHRALELNAMAHREPAAHEHAGGQRLGESRAAAADPRHGPEPGFPPRLGSRCARVPQRPADHGHRQFGVRSASGGEHLQDERAHAAQRRARGNHSCRRTLAKTSC